MAEIRVYAAVYADTLAEPAEQQWHDLFGLAKTYPLASTVLAFARSAQNYLTYNKRSQGPGHENRYTLIGFEIDDQNVPDIQDMLEDQAALRGIIGGPVAMFTLVLQGELQDAAAALGYGGQASKLTIPWLTQGTRGEAIRAAQTYIAANDSVWHSLEAG